MTRCLLDTDILSEIIKGKDLAVASRVREYLEAHERLLLRFLSLRSYTGCGVSVGRIGCSSSKPLRTWQRCCRSTTMRHALLAASTGISSGKGEQLACRTS